MSDVWDIKPSPAHLPRLSDEEIVRDALKNYERTFPLPTAQMYLHPDDRAEYARRLERTRAMSGDAGAQRSHEEGSGKS